MADSGLTGGAGDEISILGRVHAALFVSNGCRALNAMAKGAMRAVLTEHECEVLKLRLTDNLTPEQIGQRLGITSERVRQIETSAKRKLRRARVIPPVSN